MTVPDQVTTPQEQQTPEEGSQTSPLTPAMFGPGASQADLSQAGYNQYGMDIQNDAQHNQYGMDMSQVNRPPTIPLNVAQQRAERFDYALNMKSPGINPIIDDLMNGKEFDIRNTAVQDANLEADQRVQENIQKYISSGSTPTPDDVVKSWLSDLTAPRQDIDPNTILEKKYADRIVNDTLSLGDNDIYSYAANYGNLQDYTNAVMTSKEDIARREIVRKVVEEAEAAVKNENWYQWNSEVVQNIWTAGLISTMMLGRGSTRQKEIEDLYQQTTGNLEAFEKRLRDRVTSLQDINNDVAVEFAKQAYGYSNSDAYYTNLWLYGTLASLVPAYSGAKYGIKALSNLIVPKAGTVATPAANMMSTAQTLANATAQGTVSPIQLADAANPFLASQIGALRAMGGVNAMETLASTTGSDAELRSVMSMLFSIHNPNAVIGGAQSLTSNAERELFIKTMFNETNNVLHSLFIAPLTIHRMSADQITSNFNLARLQLEKEFPSVANKIINVTHIPAENTLTRTDHYAIDVGQFNTQTEAYAFAQASGITPQITKDFAGNGYASGITPLNGKYTLRVFKTLDETSEQIRNKLGTATTDISSWKPYKFQIINKYINATTRSIKDFLAPEISKYTDIASVSMNEARRAAKPLFDAVDTVRRGSKDSADKFINYLARQRDDVNPKGIKGAFDASVPEFEKNWHDQYGRLPTSQETTGYFAYTRLSDIEYVSLNLGILRDKQRLGFSDYRLPFQNSGAIADKKTLVTDAFHGKVLMDGVPKNFTEDARILDATSLSPGDWNMKNLSDFSQMDSKGTRADWGKKGYRVLQVEPMQAMSALKNTRGLVSERAVAPSSPGGVAARVGTHIAEDMRPFNYVLIKDAKQEPLQFQQLPYRGGGHRALENPWMVSQPNIDTMRTAKNMYVSRFFGDKNIMSAATERDAKAYAENAENARQIYARWKAEEDNAKSTKSINVRYTETQAKKDAEAFMPVGVDGPIHPSLAWRYKGKPLPIEWEDWKKHFEGPDKFLDPETPIMHRPLEQSSMDFHNLSTLEDSTIGGGVRLFPNLIKATEAEHSPYQNAVSWKWATEKGDHIPSISGAPPVTPGGRYNPAFNIVNTNYIDPYVMLKQSFAAAARSRSLDDLKFRVAENYVQAFKDAIDLPIEKLRADPFQALASAPLKQPLGEDQALVNAAYNYRKSAMQFLNIKTERQTTVDYLKTSMEKNISEKLGIDTKAISRVYPWSNLSDGPTAWLRGLAFDASKIFSPAQVVLQGLTAVNNIAVLGVRQGLGAMTGGFWLSALGRNAGPNTLAFVDKLARNMPMFGMDNLKEAYEALDRTGFRIIGKESADRNNFMDISFADGSVEKAREAGRVFFKMGEGYSRMSAWTGAFNEWRIANPNARLTDRVLADIMYRANTLSLDMMSSGAAAWQKGMLSIPTEFSSWSARLAEQMLPGYLGGSSRVTPQEKIGLWLTYGTIFGLVPTLTGAVSVLPIHKYIREAAQNYFNVQTPMTDNMVAESLNHGIVQTLSHHIGPGDYNFSDRFGPGGISSIQRLATGEQSIWATLIGPSGELLSNTMNAATPFLRYATGIFDSSPDRWKLTDQDWGNVLRDIGSLNHTWQAIAAYNTGIYISKSGYDIDRDFSAKDAIMLGLTGAIPQRLDDAYQMQFNNHEIKAMQDRYKPDIIRLLRSSQKALGEGDYDTARDIQAQAKAYLISGGYDNSEDRNKIFKEAYGSGSKSMQERIEQDFLRMHPEVRKNIIDGVISNGK